jgi:hypothetical protein
LPALLHAPIQLQLARLPGGHETSALCVVPSASGASELTAPQPAEMTATVASIEIRFCMVVSAPNSWFEL